MNGQTSTVKIIVYVLAAIGLVAVIGCLGMWAMHKSMMGQLSRHDIAVASTAPSIRNPGTPILTG
jgi:hypothetical protein